MDTVDRLKMRLENHRELSATAHGAGGRGAEPWKMNAGCVELIEGGTKVKPPSWAEIPSRAPMTGSVGAGCVSGYDWTLNAVRIPENNAACQTSTISIVPLSRDSKAYPNWYVRIQVACRYPRSSVQPIRHCRPAQIPTSPARPSCAPDP